MSFSLQIIGAILLLTATCPYLATSAYLGYEESVDPPPLLALPLGLLESGSYTASEEDGPISRPTEITDAERETMISAHNKYRRQLSPTAANINALMWDSDLAAMAQGWSDQCYFAHGNPENSSPFGSVGQNLYIRWSSQTDPEAPDAGIPVDRWHNEVNYYNYEDRSCSKVCGHYTQVVWAKTTHLGCGKTLCETATNGKQKTYNNAWIIACNYGPSGNYQGQHPYIEGDKCTKCKDPSTCSGNLCTACSLEEKGCSCGLVCENCGHQNTTNGACKCSCPKGFWGNNCEKTCENTHKNCGASPGWPSKKFCNRSPSIPTHCPLMCELCEQADPDFVCE